MYIGTGLVILIFCDFLKNRTFFIQKVYFGRYQHFSEKYSVTYIYICLEMVLATIFCSMFSIVSLLCLPMTLYTN